MNNNENITSLGYYLNRAFTLIVDNLDRALADASLPLNHSRFSILQVLARSNKEIMSQREISLALGKDPAAISRSLQTLEIDGLIERHPVSGCKNGVSLTEKSRRLRPKIEKVIRQVTTELCDHMSTEEIEAGISFLHKILNRPDNK